jgi:HAD superfamily hydrolase (TIGR01509 family)
MILDAASGETVMLAQLLKESKAVLFDFDGVIADSEPFFYESYNRAFTKRGHPLDRDEYWVYWTGRGEGVAGEIRRHNLPFGEEDARAIYAERRATYSEFCRTGSIPLFPGMMDAVEALVKRGMACAIASNSFEDDILAVLRHAGYPDPPLPVIGRREGLGTKPAPDIFIYTAGYVRAEPAACLVVEDAHKGLASARAAGMACAIVRTPYNRDVDFSAADAVLENHAAFVQEVMSR